MGAAVIAAAAAATRAREQIISHFMAANAVAVDKAVPFTPGRSLEARQLEELQRAGVIKPAGRGAYIDIPAYAAWRQQMRKRQSTATVIAVIGACVLIGAGLLTAIIVH
ncbi:hypothetical protein ACLB0R_13810 [Sphingomonas sp. GlSt437]|uniref:hypothetical protein n=1 Tax=Sphingomonas sp. GlSt437 TaxID=3389970 RepID=UPI003A87DFE6